MDTYTPGPWHLDDCGVPTRLVVVDSKGNSVPIANGSIENAWDDDAEARANARLFASAPELLEALEGVLLSENDTHRQSDDRWSVFRQNARAAITKARGQ